jgi:Flp pilus assembly protein TadB
MSMSFSPNDPQAAARRAHQQAMDAAKRASDQSMRFTNQAAENARRIAQQNRDALNQQQQRQFSERLHKQTSSQIGDNRNRGSSALGRFLFMIIVLGFLAFLGFFGFIALTIIHH